MATIDNSVGGVGNFKLVARTIQWAVINKDPSRHGDRVDGGWWLLFDRGQSNVIARFDGAAERHHGWRWLLLTRD
jgi:hypothetical protein